ncbi:MAG: hypothetical protein INR71_14750 [Terriglobus roseus]|nr:hypothetical protein [Terriglobus roseus]
MHSALAILALAASTAFALPQGVNEQISPDGSAPSGCESSHDGSFELTVVDASGKTKRSIKSVSTPLLQIQIW